MEDTVVKFNRAYQTWNAGETASFPAFRAEGLVKAGYAKPVPTRLDIARKIGEAKMPILEPVKK
jgi:hypothetical protein